MYERRWQPPIPRRAFLLRLLRHGGFAAGILAFSLLVGIAGYYAFEKLSWVDGFLNSAMLLGGMGPVDPPKTTGGKLFAGIYALYAGLIVITVASVIGAPIFHRLLHRFHFQEQEGDDEGETDKKRPRRRARSK